MSPGGTKPFESPVRTPGWMTQKQPFPLTQMKSPPSVCTQNITGPPGGQSEHGGEFKENTALLQSLDLFSPLRSFEETNTREEEGVWGRGGSYSKPTTNFLKTPLPSLSLQSPTPQAGACPAFLHVKLSSFYALPSYTPSPRDFPSHSCSKCLLLKINLESLVCSLFRLPPHP